MPNWCYNEMTICADTQEAQKQARELMKCSIKVKLSMIQRRRI